ncbi:autotransporter domain-containing protein [Providencia sp. Je.9.19]|uniref:autotransporter domain-containing protein n=1 Tax=Providencia sp. Je.9.19 TaxID=3142844 RepID=UPI003DA9286C
MKSVILPTTISLLVLLNSNISSAKIDIEAVENRILDKRNSWLDDIKNNVINHSPIENSKIALWDKLISHEYTQITDERLERAKADKSQNSNYVFSTFNTILFGDHQIDLTANDQYHTIKDLYDISTRAYDENRRRVRSIDFILKEHFQRGRPYQVLDKDGNYIANYTAIRGSSFPSGHTWNGFKQAAVLATLFPEKGDEIFARAIEYGESRVIVGAHFPTDTIASRIGNYYLLSQLLADDKIAKSFVTLARNVREETAITCQKNIKDCLTTSSHHINDEVGYYGKKEPEEKPMITPNELPNTAAHLLRLRFSYLDKEQRQSILASTAYPINSLAGWDVKKDKPETYWGLINLPRAYQGPTHLYDNFIVNQVTNEFDFANFTELDEWKNAINGPGQLIKKGNGTLILSGENTFAGIEVNQGNLVLNAKNHYSKPSSINGGSLFIKGQLNSPLDVNKGALILDNGKINSQVTLNQSGLLTGNGQINHLTVNQEAMVSPGHSIGTINITDSVIFKPDSHYLVEINAQGKHDTIKSQGTAVLNGGTVTVSFENNKNKLSKQQVNSLFDTQYTILSAEKGIRGKFEAVQPNYLFIGTTLNYSPNAVTLNIGRNNTSFDSVATTQNQKSVAQALDKLPTENSLYKSILKNDSKDEAISIFNTLTGQVHADILSNQINSSRHTRETIFKQLRLSESLNKTKEQNDNKGNIWAKALHDWDNTTNDGNAEGYDTSSYGVFLGADQRFYRDKATFGLATGFTKNSLSGHHNSGNSENYHLALYGGIQLNPITLRAGAEHTWHHINTHRSVSQSMGNYQTQTHQAFIEAAYPLKAAMFDIEPFANLTYVKATNGTIKETGNYGVLKADKQHINGILSTIGVRLDNQWMLNSRSSLNLYGELGWQHQYGDLARGLKFKFLDTDSSFVSQSSSASRNGAIIKAGVDLNINNNSKLSINYSKLASSNYADNNIDAKISLIF